MSVGIDSTNHIFVRFSNTTSTDVVVTGSVVSSSAWHCVQYKRVSLGGGNFRTDVRLDGMLVATDASSSAVNPASATFHIFMGVNVFGDSRFSGYLDTWRISNIARSDANLTSFYLGTQ